MSSDNFFKRRFLLGAKPQRQVNQKMKSVSEQNSSNDKIFKTKLFLKRNLTQNKILKQNSF